MEDRTRELLDAAVREQLDAHGRVLPPPRDWLDRVAHQLWPEVDFGEAGVRRLAEHGIGAAR
ncbi:hypothetical protein [Micromonospora coxensis]|uniref:Uncharacterized protein n=1 Tax=Micromonospora coxensis TaxID=356852 RepID=A0A1C5HDZ2_9ACTN|nr:hypothetical protein [Micromonospora coxensis]SCG44225.1 hypothetical protein GA0070614_1187 [Micromonospora coxensis]